MITYRAEELAQSGRMLTIFALYVSYTGDSAFMLSHFNKARSLARWLLYRYEMSLQWPVDDPRHGIVAGGDEGDGFVAFYETYGNQTLQHQYSCTSNVYRGFADIGLMWRELGESTKRADVKTHADELLEAAPKLLAALKVSHPRPTSHPPHAAPPYLTPTPRPPLPHTHRRASIGPFSRRVIPTPLAAYRRAPTPPTRQEVRGRWSGGS